MAYSRAQLSHRILRLDSALTPSSRRRLFRWGVMDVLAACGAEHSCKSCALWDDCKTITRRASDERTSTIGAERTVTECARSHKGIG